MRAQNGRPKPNLGQKKRSPTQSLYIWSDNTSNGHLLLNMNSQITATIGFSRTIFIKLQNITLALGNISANIFPKILPLQVQQGLGRASANFQGWKRKDETSRMKCHAAKFDRISDFPV